ncbi:hypothetical protein K3495_g4587 [Podosphaera aphanis]|nr:hypothetical protein K3495_g4587 [Podosphaera aphanis]
MAQSDVTISSSSKVSFAAQELCEILEYERIVQFCDSVLAGSHPRVKIPVQLSKPSTLPNSSSSNETSSPANTKTPTKSLTSANTGETMSFNRAPNAQCNTSSRLAISTKSKINPVLLEKSEDLIKAELNLHRQRLERAIKEQVEHQRVSTKTLLRTSESLPNFDVSEVLSKAHAIVQPSPAEDEPSAGAHSSGSDSFDDNTFYSSQCDTPEPSSLPQDQKTLVYRYNQNASVAKQYSEHSPKASHGVTPPDSSQLDKVNISAQDSDPDTTLKSYSTAKKKQYEVGPSDSSIPEETHRQENFSKITRQHSTDLKAAPKNYESNTSINSFANPMPSNKHNSTQDKPSGSRTATNHNIKSPLVVSQSNQVSPSTTSRGAIPPRPAAGDEGQPAQISALRQEHRISSTDSSPIGKDNERREIKIKRNTKDDSASDSPYIKPEPQSPSPLLSMARPPKRQRAFDDREAGPEHSAQERLTDSHREAWRPYERDRQFVPLDYQPRHRRPEGDEICRRYSNEDFVRFPRSPGLASSYRAGEIRSRASSIVMGRRPLEDGRFYKEPMTRASAYPEADRNRSRSPLRENVIMGPPRQPVRVIIDERGRQPYNYSPTSRHPSVVPMIRYREDELMYERLPTRTVSGRLPTKIYDEEDICSRRGSPALMAPRRTVTQPEYFPVPINPRVYREREYSARPSGINSYNDNFVSYRVAPENRQISHYEDSNRDYWQSTSNIPGSLSYGAPVEYTGRMQSVRPEIPVDGPERRREIATQAQREYSVRPIDPVTQREIPLDARYYEEIPTRRVLARGASVYYNDPPTRRPIEVGVNDGFRYEERYRRRPTDVEYIEEARVREPSIIVYGEGSGREAYR